jgi:hypothetical protein
MRAIRAKKIRHAMNSIFAHHRAAVTDAAQTKANMLNRNGGMQHTTINPLRQLKKMVVRERIA